MGCPREGAACLSTKGKAPGSAKDTRASHVRVWVTQEVDLLGRTQPNKSAWVSRFRRPEVLSRSTRKMGAARLNLLAG